MARACLTVDISVTEAFLAAQEDKTVRCLNVVVSEESLILGSKLTCTSTAEQDFESFYAKTLPLNSATLSLFCIDDDRTSVTSSKWILIAWIPDTTKVRDKMLYSSSREDLKKTLGLGYFSSEYYANSIEDMTWRQVSDYMSSDSSKTVFSEHEVRIQKEKALTHVESNVTKSNAMGALPFSLSEEATTALNQFKNNEVNWIEMYVQNESVHVHQSKYIANIELSPLAPLVPNTDGRFIAARLPKKSEGYLSFFVFSCPENTPVRMKMTMSSCKATVIGIATGMGVTFDKNIEIRSPEDIDESIRAELVDQVAAGASSSAASMAHARPSRPGRGKAKVSKFKGDDEDA